MTLDEIGIKNATDKSSLSHCYLPFYQILFAKFSRDSKINILEVGVQFGCSIRTWIEWFPLSWVVGIDSVDNQADTTGAKAIIFADAYEDQSVDKAREYGPYSIMIDDGFHAVHHQQWFIFNYSQLLADGGLMIVEDVHGLEAIPDLVKAVPEGYYFCSIDLTYLQRNTNDSILFLVWHK